MSEANEQLDKATVRIGELERALRAVARNDKSRYDHHEARPFDGMRPMQAKDPGSIWLTPREIARRVLREPDLATLSDIATPEPPHA